MRTLPRWLFVVFTIGGLLASGIYLGIARVEGASTGVVLRAVGYGAFGLLMLWGAVARR